MIKKLMMILIMVVLLLVPVSAFSFLPRIYGIRFNQEVVEETKPACINTPLFATEIKILNSIDPVLEGLTTFKDGYHVIYLSKGRYYGHDYYTVLKEGGTISYIKPGFCASDSNFHKYTVKTDLNGLEQKLMDPHTDYINEGYKLIKSIDGISIGQVFHLIRTAIKYGVNQ